MFDSQREAKSSIESSQQSQKKYFDARHQPPTYEVGDMVLLNNARRAQRKGDKLVPRLIGPFEISEVRQKGTLRLVGNNTRNTYIRP